MVGILHLRFHSVNGFKYSYHCRCPDELNTGFIRSYDYIFHEHTSGTQQI